MRAQPVNTHLEIGREELGRLQVALDPPAVTPYLEAAYGDVLRLDDRRRPVRCHILDVKYEPGRGCTILYDVGGRLVLGTLGQRALNQPRSPSRSIDRLEMQAYLFPHDPALPDLAQVFDEDGMRTVLTEVLPACRAGEMRILRCRTTLLRYRPTRRCTVRFDLSLVVRGTGAVVPRVLYGKVYHDLAKATCVFADMQMLFAASALRAAGVAVAEAVAFVPDLALILQEPLTGTPLDALLGRRAGAGGSGSRHATEAVVRVAEALASMHTARLQAARRRAIVPTLKRMAERASAIRLVDQQLGSRMAQLADVLLADARGLDDLGARTHFVHGDCKPSQFLLGSYVAMLDVDHAGSADPACDVGDFTAALRQLSIREAVRAQRRRLPPPELGLDVVEERFLSHYRERVGSDPGLPARIAWYQALALLRKAIRGFQRSPLSPIPALLVDESSRCLETWSAAGGWQS